jgi:Galactose oxidase-like, Early set domain/Divergent InlB B-repeat domain
MLPPRSPRRIDTARCRHADGSRASACLGPVHLLLLLAALVLPACQGEQDALSPELRAAKLPRVLTVTGGGTGGGHVTAPDYGETPAMDCEIINGTNAPEKCALSYGWKTQVQLQATANAGSSFTGWSGACTGTAPTCKATMTQSRSVKATFAGQATQSYTLNVTGGGDGNGTVTSQAGLTPAINCTVTSGSAVGGICGGSYPQGTGITLTATASAGHTFAGWSGNCSGTGPCALTMSTNRAAGATFSAPAGIEATVGRWDAPRSTPIIGLHTTLLLTGKVLMWGHGGEAQLWDPAGGGFTQKTDATCTNPTNCELFCSGHTFLSDGSLLVAGGHNEALGDNNGLNQASRFDGTSWSATGSMLYPRWYPTLVTLGDGSVVAMAGNQAPSTPATIPERYTNGTWTALTGAGKTLPLYPRAFVEPKTGRVFVAGDMATSQYLTPSGSGSWASGATRVVADRNYGSAVMLDTKVLYVGGGGSGCTGAPPQSSAEMIDLAATTPAWSAVAPMAIGRRQTTAIILADGTVLVTGGSSQCGFTNEAGAVFAPELWNPSPSPLGTWTTMANASVVRVYHSTTVLLPDGRVLSTGSGDGGGVTQQYTYEIYSPPYLFKGARPTYNLSSNALHYGLPFPVTTPNGAAIRKVTLIRLASSTHAFDMGQRLNTLAFQAAGDGQSLSVTPPASGNLAPPGPYLLFIINDKGAPSVAQTVLLGP